MKRSGISRLAVGALLACEVGSLNAGTVGAASVIDAIPGVSAIKSAAAATGKFAKDNPILFSSIAMPFINKAFDAVPRYTKKAINYVKNTFFNSNDFCPYDEVTENFKNNSRNVPGLKEAKKESLKIARTIAEDKSINARSEDNGNASKKQSHVVIFTNSNSSVRRDLVKAFSSSLYTGDPLVLDLTKCSSKSDLSSALLPGEADFFSSKKSSDTSGDKLQDYKERNDHGVVILKLSSKGIEAIDGIFSELLRHGSNGVTTLKGKKFEAGNLTFVVEIEGSISDPDSLKFLDFADRIDFPPEVENTEISKLVKKSFENPIEYWQEDINVNSGILLKSVYEALNEAKDGSSETTLGLVDDFNRYMAKNKGEFVGKKVFVYYDKEKCEFSSFETLIKNWKEKGINVNSKILLKSIYEALRKTKGNSIEEIRQLASVFNQYMSKNENEFAGKKVLVYYDEEKGEFSIKEQEKTTENEKNIKQMLSQKSSDAGKGKPKQQKK